MSLSEIRCSLSAKRQTVELSSSSDSSRCCDLVTYERLDVDISASSTATSHLPLPIYTSYDERGRRIRVTDQQPSLSDSSAV